MITEKNLRNLLSSLFLLFSVASLIVPQAQNFDFRGAQFTFTLNGGNASPVCGDNALTFDYTGSVVVDSLYWDFDDALAGTASNGSGTPISYQFLNAGTYDVSVTGFDIAGVAVGNTTNSIDVALTPPTTTTAPSICTNSTLILDATQPFSTYSWTPGGSVSPTYNATAADTIVTCGVTNICGSGTLTFNQQHIDSVFVDILDFVICPGDIIPILDAIQPASAQPVSYLWSSGSTAATDTITTQGTYWVSMTNPCGSYVDTFIATTPPPLTVDVGPDTLICQGQSYTITATTNQPNVQYQWMGNPNNGGTTFTVNSGGTYWVAATNDCEFVYDTIVISQPQSFILDLGNDTIICNGDQIVLDPGLGGAPFIFDWDDGSTDSIRVVTTAGTYFVEVMDSCSTQFDTIVISTPPAFTFDLGNDTTFCAADNIVLDPGLTGPQYNYVWQDGSTTATYTVTDVGTYSVTITDECVSVSDAITFTPFTGFEVTLGNDTTICDGQSFQLQVSFPNSTYLWQDGTTTPTYTVSDPGDYYVTIFNVCDTVMSDTLTTEVDPCSCNMYVPNAFTPNVDGKNEIFRPVTDFTSCVVLEFEMRIFNRWGQELFVSTSIADGWDGTFNGEYLMENVYFYEIIYSVRNQGETRVKQDRLTGNLFMIR